VFPDGLAALFRPAAALPASLLMPVVPAPLPAVVPLVDPGAPAAAPPVPELPPAPLPPACARAKVLVNASAMANPIVASFMIAPFFVVRNGATRCARMRSCLSITVRCCSAEMTQWPQLRNRADTFRVQITTEDCLIELAALSRPLSPPGLPGMRQCPLLSSFCCSTSP
jgi:hypothetical protein